MSYKLYLKEMTPIGTVSPKRKVKPSLTTHNGTPVSAPGIKTRLSLVETSQCNV